MSKVIDMQSAREERQPHCAGYAFCIDCKHKWVQVAPTTTDGPGLWLECPKCSRVTGRWSNWFTWEGHFHWTCPCGNDIFRLYRGDEGQPVIGCPNCGSSSNIDTLPHASPRT